MYVRTGIQAFGATGFRPVAYSNVLAGRSLVLPQSRPMRRSSPSFRNLGQALKVSEIPRTIALGAAGAAALALAGALPAPLNSVSLATGLGLLGYGVYNLFSGKVPTEKETVRLPLPEGQTLENTRVSGSFKYPAKGELVSQDIDGTYRLAFSVTNRSEMKVDVFATIRVEEFPRVIGERGVQEKHFELRGIEPGQQKGFIDPEFPATYWVTRHDAVATLSVQVANDDPGGVIAVTSFALEFSL